MSVRLSARRETPAVDAIMRAQFGASQRDRAFTGIDRLSGNLRFPECTVGTLRRRGRPY